MCDGKTESVVGVKCIAHACQLKVKVSLEAAFRDCLVPSLRLGMPVVEAPPQDLRQSRF
ncbi:hypothetical protein [Nostoc sp. JL33]|uniref:hypothetical protein n=1 Tax=Nostoc sp. JL33 TaxID=2815396 RepID=UPI0025D6ECDB|nr:hypothetical protein [Nostoc sp. JL33]MBN3869047.1 hypothetical protein [Nostoc sp. JL33]